MCIYFYLYIYIYRNIVTFIFLKYSNLLDLYSGIFQVISMSPAIVLLKMQFNNKQRSRAETETRMQGDDVHLGGQWLDGLSDGKLIHWELGWLYPHYSGQW